MYNMTSEYAPLTLNSEWRLFFLMLFTGTGTVTNGFFIATFFTTPELMKKGHLFLACLGFSDLIITGMVVPCVVVIVMSRASETTLICQILQVLVEWSTYAYSVFFMLVSIDIYIRLLRGYSRYTACMTYPICMVAILTFVVTLATAAVGVYQELDYDYCHHEHYGNYWFRVFTSITFYVIPSFVTIILLLRTSFVMKKKVVGFANNKKCYLYERDRVLTNLHLGCYCFFVSAWLPYLTVVNLYPDTGDSKYYALIWIGLIRSGVTGLVYSVLNEIFRQAFEHLFVYFCCKGDSPLSFNGHNNKTSNHNNTVISKLNSSGGRDAVGCTL